MAKNANLASYWEGYRYAQYMILLFGTSEFSKMLDANHRRDDGQYLNGMRAGLDAAYKKLNVKK